MAHGPDDGGQIAPTRVVAAILHETRRVLTVQRVDDDRWRPPVGDVDIGETVLAAARRHVRRATGLEIIASGEIDRYVVHDRQLAVVHCRVGGIGSDIAPDIRALRWLTRSDVLALPAADWTAGVLASLGTASNVTAVPTYSEKRVALAS